MDYHADLTIKKLIELLQQTANNSPLGMYTCVYVNTDTGYQVPRFDLKYLDGAVLVINPDTDPNSDYWGGYGLP